MIRALAALGVVVALALPVSPASADPSVTPGCDDPVDVVCNMGYCPGEACTPLICVVWMNGRCVY